LPLFVVAVVVVIFRSSRCLLGGLLLFLVLWLGLLRQRLFQDLKNFLISDLLVGLELGEIRSWWCS
jgi:hypothetical protein